MQFVPPLMASKMLISRRIFEFRTKLLSVFTRFENFDDNLPLVLSVIAFIHFGVLSSAERLDDLVRLELAFFRFFRFYSQLGL